MNIESNTQNTVENTLEDNIIIPYKNREFIYMIIPYFYGIYRNELKIGKTKKICGRFGGYAKKSTLIYLSEVKNCDISERFVLDEFNKKYQKTQGNEYFEGDIESMVKHLYLIFDYNNEQK